MTKHTVRRHMTPDPIVISSDRTLAQAHELMRTHRIRHLPVVDAGRLVGILSQRDLYLLETLPDVDGSTETVAEAMIADPYCTTPDAALHEVAARMAEHKFGAAVVLDEGRVVGVFTSVDALRVLASLLAPARSRAAVHELRRGA